MGNAGFLTLTEHPHFPCMKNPVTICHNNCSLPVINTLISVSGLFNPMRTGAFSERVSLGGGVLFTPLGFIPLFESLGLSNLAHS